MSLIGFKANNHRQQVRKRGAKDEIDDRRTPDDFWRELDEEFGFSLDAAASRENAKCFHFFDREADGLLQSWADHNVWCNPPYSDIPSWIRKATEERDHTNRIVLLLPANRTEQKWWQEYVEPGRRDGSIEVRFLPGRMRFVRPGWTKPAKGDRPPFGLCLVVME